LFMTWKSDGWVGLTCASMECARPCELLLREAALARGSRYART
jgi:hypothetical protein